MNETRPQFGISMEQINAMANIVLSNPRDFFLSEQCRRFLARDRWNSSGKKLRIHESPDAGVMPGTITHNRAELDENLFNSARRTVRLINPLSAIDPIYSGADTLKVLSIGPRTEMELIHLIGVGFTPENISAVDLLSSSPMIDVGDMHNLPYPDRSFDVVISGWSIAYSDRPQRVVDEMIRVARNGALIAIGCTYDPTFDVNLVGARTRSTDISGNMFGSSAELAKLMGPHLDRVCFQHDSVDPKQPGFIMIIARIRHNNSPTDER